MAPSRTAKRQPRSKRPTADAARKTGLVTARVEQDLADWLAWQAREFEQRDADVVRRILADARRDGWTVATSMARLAT